MSGSALDAWGLGVVLLVGDVLRCTTWSYRGEDLCDDALLLGAEGYVAVAYALHLAVAELPIELRLYLSPLGYGQIVVAPYESTGIASELVLVVVGAVIVSACPLDELGIGDGEQAIAVLDLYEDIVPKGAVLASGALWCVTTVVFHKFVVFSKSVLSVFSGLVLGLLG